NYGVTIENANGDSTQATLNTIITQLTNILNAINSGEGEGTADSKITNFLNNILVTKDTNQIESIKQSINFLRAFYEGYNGKIGKDSNAVTKTHSHFFSGDAYTNATNKYKNAIKGGMTSLKNTINGKLTDIKNLEDTLKRFEEALKKAEELNNQGKDLNTQVENIKNQVEALDGEIAKLQQDIKKAEQIGMRPEYIAYMKKDLEVMKQKRSDLKTQVANIIDHQIKVLKDT
ncbi:hypothetical protein, partial [Helicobacter pullorum]|uniref:hypothetical protein n=1 Tax=Helicobacter pullorum TaxID=35818 RepID=UPI000B3165AE